MALLPLAAHAAGLGKLTMLSALGEPLAAEIELVSVQKDEASSLTARLAPAEAFRAANLTFSPALVGARLSIERRANGQHYIRLSSSRPVNEPFLDLLVELNWGSGRLVREYTALIDPPQFARGGQPGSASAVPVTPPQGVPVAPPSAATTAPPPPAQAREPASAKARPAPQPKTAAAPAPAGRSAGAGDYTVQRGDTLYKIASDVKPQGITLEQMLTALYKSNPEAFQGNMNRLKTGRILKVPDAAEASATPQTDAVKEVRVQAADWNAYRKKLAETPADTATAESKPAAGKISTAVEEKGVKGLPRDVVRLSKGAGTSEAEAGKGGKPLSAKERLRVLEEEATAKEKALAEANERIAQLERNIADMQKLLQLKGSVPVPSPAAPKAEPPKPAPEQKAAPAETKAAPAAPPPAEAAKAVAPEAGTAQAPQPAPEAPKAAAPKPKPKPAPPPPPPPPPSLVDQILDEPLYLAGGAGALALLLGGGFVALKRRRSAAAASETDRKIAPKLGAAAGTAASAASMMQSTVMMPAQPQEAHTMSEADVYIDEADMFMKIGRDAQAEERLKEALDKEPGRQDAQLKLLEIYAVRKDKTAFEQVAKTMQAATGGSGDSWLRVAALGYALDASNALYAAGKDAQVAAPHAVGGSGELDFDLDLDGKSVAQTDVLLDTGDRAVAAATAFVDTADPMKTVAAPPGAAAPAVAAGMVPDFTLDVASILDTKQPDITIDSLPDAAKPEITQTNEVASIISGPNVIDFSLDQPAPAADAADAITREGTVILTPEHAEKAAELALDVDIGAKPPADTNTPLVPDFKLDFGAPSTPAPAGAEAPPVPTETVPDLDFGSLNLSMDGAGDGAAPGGDGTKDAHWYDVQTKFDLAKAYQEMGDKDGAREILQEVMKEGDSAQQAEAKKLLDSFA